MRILTFLAIFCTPIFLTAQLELGFRMGVNMTEADLKSFQNQPFETAKMNGIHAGAFANFQLGTAFALQPEIVFSQKGFSATWNSADSSSTMSTDYLEVPVLLEFGFPLGKNIRLYGNAGPNVSYLLQAREEFFNATSGETSVTIFDMREESLNRMDFGVNFGAGISVRINRWKIILDSRYQMGMNEIMESESANDFFETAKHRVTNLGLSVSYFVFGGNKEAIRTQ